jgi:hypothetical protein
MSYPPGYPNDGTSRASSASLGTAVALGAAVALGGSVIVGTIFGLTNYQSTYVSIVLGWLVGLVVSRAGREMTIAVAAGVLALAGSALGSLLGIIIGLVKTVHVPLWIVLSNMGRVISLVPHVIGGFGFVCWALSGVVGWAIVRSRGGRTLRRITQPVSPGQLSGGMTYRPLAGGSSPDIQASGVDIQPMSDNPPADGPAPQGPS